MTTVMILASVPDMLEIGSGGDLLPSFKHKTTRIMDIPLYRNNDNFYISGTNFEQLRDRYDKLNDEYDYVKFLESEVIDTVRIILAYNTKMAFQEAKLEIPVVTIEHEDKKAISTVIYIYSKLFVCV
jgi:hypothetical protein